MEMSYNVGLTITAFTNMMHSYESYSWWGPGAFVGLGFLGVFGFVLVTVLIVVMIALKGYALWYAAKRDEKWWFVIMLIINTAGILELVYLVFIVKKWHTKLTDKVNSGPSAGTTQNK